MTIARNLASLKLWGTLCVLLACAGVFVQPAQAQRRHRMHHRHRVVRMVRVRRNGHWITIRRVVYR